MKKIFLAGAGGMLGDAFYEVFKEVSNSGAGNIAL